MYHLYSINFYGGWIVEVFIVNSGICFWNFRGVVTLTLDGARRRRLPALITMPALNFFGRAWLVATDDLPVPMMCLMFVHTVW